MILVGSSGKNSVVYLKELELIEDPLVCYNFHYDEPQVFTHQQAGFSEEMWEIMHILFLQATSQVAVCGYLTDGTGTLVSI